MKKILFVYLAVIQVTLLYSCSNRKQAITFPVVTIAVENNEEGVVLVRSSGYGGTEAAAVRHAEIKAFRNLLFYGFTSAKKVKPVVEEGEKVQRKYAGFFKEFFESSGYSPFILSSHNYSSVEHTGHQYYLNRDVKINLRSLTTFLEKNGIIRKFGY